MPTNTASSSTDRTAALMRVGVPMALSADREAVYVGLGLRWIEGLLHHRETLARAGGRRETRFLHEADRVGGKKYLTRHLGVVDLALDLSPALHLGEDPDGERMPREGSEIDPGRPLAHIAAAIAAVAR